MEEELQYVGEYGLRNKTEFWRHRTKLGRYRQIARQLRTMPIDQQEKRLGELVGKLTKLGILPPGEHTFDDVLNLSIRDILNRRLQSYIAKIGLAKNVYQARQFIVHRHIAVDGQIIDSPSYIVKVIDEDNVKFAHSSPFADRDHKIHLDMSLGEVPEEPPEEKKTKRPSTRRRARPSPEGKKEGG